MKGSSNIIPIEEYNSDQFDEEIIRRRRISSKRGCLYNSSGNTILSTIEQMNGLAYEDKVLYLDQFSISAVRL